MGKIRIGKIKSDDGKGPVFLLSDDIYDARTGKTLSVVISEIETLKEAITIFFKGPIKETGNIDRLSEIVAEIEANKKKLAALNKAQFPPNGYELAEGIKVVPVTIVKKGVKAPGNAGFVIELEELDIESPNNP